MKIVRIEFGKLKDGKHVHLYTLHNNNGMKVSILNYGGIITQIITEDKHGNYGNVTLGYNNLDSYIDHTVYFGAIIGRYANRIGGGKFTLEGKEYQLDLNDPPNHLHGGEVSFDKVVWNAKTFKSDDSLRLILSYLSRDGESGYPGNLSTEVIYTLTNENEIVIEYSAKTDKTTICNLTNHAYFNLKDGGNSSIINHKIKIKADYYTPIDKTCLPTGEILPVRETPFDFNQMTEIKKAIESKDDQLANGLGYDHNFVIKGKAGELRKAARVLEDTSGRILEVFTTEPGIQFYTGNHLDGSKIGYISTAYNYRSGFCLETQHYPNSPNNPNFPSTILRPGEVYKSTTIYKFSTIKYNY